VKSSIVFFIALLITTASCKNDQNLPIQVCNIEEQNIHSKFFKKHFELNFLSNLEEAINCSKEINKPIFIMFVHSPLSGILNTVKKNYKNQVSYLFDCKKCLKIINREYIPVLLHTDIRSKVEFDEESNIKSQALLDKIIIMNQLNENKLLNTKSKYYGKFHQKIQIAATQSSSTISYLIINQNEQLMTTFGSQKESLYSVLIK